MSVARWSDPAFVEEAHAWLRQEALGLGLGPVGAIAQPHIEAWSTVFRATTPGGALYLKACGPTQAHEPALTVLLARGGRVVPRPLAIHPREHWMLLADGGTKLRDSFAAEDLLEAWVRILPRYAELQRQLLGRDDELLATGLPDRRLEGLALQLEPLLADERAVGPSPGGLSQTERAMLRGLLPTVAARCSDLASLGIGATAQHDDLHDGNVLVGSAEVVFDWGDACLTHPFLTLCVTLRSAAHRAGLAVDDPRVVRLRDAYLETWSHVASPSALREAAELARVLGAATRALCWYRVVSLIGGSLDDPDGWLRELAEQLPR